MSYIKIVIADINDSHANTTWLHVLVGDSQNTCETSS